jgi:hypothetical protein
MHHKWISIFILRNIYCNESLSRAVHVSLYFLYLCSICFFSSSVHTKKVNWSTHVIVLFHTYLVYKEEAEEWNEAGICFKTSILQYTCSEGDVHVNSKHVTNFVLFNIFEVVRYVMF